MGWKMRRASPVRAGTEPMTAVRALPPAIRPTSASRRLPRRRYWRRSGEQGAALPRRAGSKRGVRSIAQGSVAGALAAAEIDRAGLPRLVFHRLEVAALVTTVTEGLGLTPAARTPPVALAGFHHHGIGGFLDHQGFGHHVLLAMRVMDFMIAHDPVLGALLGLGLTGL